MRIVDREAFLKLPAGTVYAKFSDQPKDHNRAVHDYGELGIKWDTCGNDFIEQSLVPFPADWHDSGDIADNYDRMLAGLNGAAPDYESAGRDGLFDEDQLFMVFTKEDHKGLIELLQNAYECY